MSYEPGEENMNEIYKKEDRPASPVALQIVGWALIASFWVYPVSEGGVYNLLHFALWSLAITAALVTFLALFIDAAPSKYRERGRITKWVARIGFWGGLAWMAYHHVYALTAFLMVSVILMRLIAHAADKRAGYA